MSVSPTLHLAPTAEDLARLFADFLVQQIAQKEGSFTWALSGGSTPKLLFSLLASPAYLPLIDWAKVQLFWGDERLVPQEDPDSNYGLTKKLLLDHLPIPLANIHPVATESSEAALLADYEQQIKQWVAEDEAGFPRFDLIMLGMGDDGHTASIFPHQMELLEAPTYTAIATHPTSGQLRLTLTGPVINRAACLAFLVAGDSKAARVAQILGQQPGYLAYPSAHIAPVDGSLHWFLDQAAAGARGLS